ALRSWRGEVEDDLLAVVQEPVVVVWFVVPYREILFKFCPCARQHLLDRNRLDPMDGVLQPEVGACRLCDVERRPRVRRFAADVEKQRSGSRKLRRRPPDPVASPIEIPRPWHRVVIGPIPDAEVIWRRCDDDVQRSVRKALEYVETITEVEAEARAADLEGRMRLGEASHQPE